MSRGKYLYQTPFFLYQTCQQVAFPLGLVTRDKETFDVDKKVWWSSTCGQLHVFELNHRAHTIYDNQRNRVPVTDVVYVRYNAVEDCVDRLHIFDQNSKINVRIKTQGLKGFYAA